MKRLLVMFATFICSVITVQATEIAVTVNRLDSSGIGDAIGVIVVSESAQGVVLKPYLRGLPPGQHNFAVHENVACTHGFRTDGSIIPGAGAGKSIRSLPTLFIDDQGSATQSIILRDMSLDELRGKTLVVYQGTKENRIACGSLELYKTSPGHSVILP